MIVRCTPSGLGYFTRSDCGPLRICLLDAYGGSARVQPSAAEGSEGVEDDSQVDGFLE
jgi:hypothetical protein